MTLDEHIARAKELIATREEIDQQLAQLFAGIAPAKKTTRCKVVTVHTLWSRESESLAV